MQTTKIKIKPGHGSMAIRMAPAWAWTICFGAVASASESVGRPAASPLTVASAQPLGSAFTTLNLDQGLVEPLRAGGDVVMSQFPLGASRFADLALHRFDVFTPDAVIVLGTAQGDVRVAKPDAVLLSGTIAGERGSRVFLSFSGDSVNGVVTTGGRTLVISSGPAGRGLAPVIFDQDAAEGSINIVKRRCGNDEIDLRTPAMKAFQRTDEQSEDGDGWTNRDAPCRNAVIAIETDNGFRALFSEGSATLAAAYAGTLIGGVSEIFKRDVNTTLQIGFLRIWTTPDPWTQSSTADQLFQFQDYWNANMTSVPRQAAHFLSGRGLGGGVAYVGALCYPGYDYGLSANLNGFFPYPLTNNHPQNWDPYVTAHELGHNFGTGHTHDINSYNPVIDGCGLGDCSNAFNGTIMSYCHTCPGGTSNIRLEFGPRVNAKILAYMDTLPECVPSVSCNPCPSDFNHDGFVTGDDFDAYVTAFEAGNISADFDGDTFVTGDDFDAYVTAFESGC